MSRRPMGWVNCIRMPIQWPRPEFSYLGIPPFAIPWIWRACRFPWDTSLAATGIEHPVFGAVPAGGRYRILSFNDGMLFKRMQLLNRQ